MKTVFMFAFLLTSQAFAAQQDETITTGGSVRIMRDLKCEIILETTLPVMQTVLSDEKGEFFIRLNDTKLKLKHFKARAEGCNVDVLKNIIHESGQFFGFLHLDNVVVERTYSKPGRSGGRLFREKVSFELAPGIVMVSEEAEFVRDESGQPVL